MNMHTAFSFSTLDREANTVWASALARVESTRVALDKMSPVLEAAETAYYACQKKWLGPARFHPEDSVATFNARMEAGAAEIGRLYQRVETAQDQQAAACAMLDEALDSLIDIPAPDLAAVIQKIEIAGRYGKDINDLAPVLVDLRRMAGALK